MTTYDVNQITGDNADDGSIGSPWKDIYHADSVISPSDVVNIIAPATNPYRGNINNIVESVTYQGENKAYLLGSIDLSNGAAIGNLVKNGDLNSWADSTNPNKYNITLTGDGYCDLESTITRSGYSAKMGRVAAGASNLNSTMFLEGGKEYTLTFYHNDIANNNRFKVSVREDLATDNFLQLNGTWGTSNYTFDDIGAVVGVWTQYSLNFTANGSGTYVVKINQAYANASYLDDISLTPTSNARSWSVYSGDTHQLTIGQEVKVLAWCTDSEWSSFGVLALDRLDMGSDKDTLNPGEFVWSSGVLYYRLDTGGSIGDIHFEGSQPLEYPTVVEDTVKITTNNVNLDNLWAGLGGANNFNITGAITGVTGDNSDSFAGGKDNIGNGWSVTSGASATLNDCTGDYDGTKAFFTNSGALVLNRCIGSFAWSGGIYSFGGSTVTANYCLSKNNGREEAADNSGFTAHTGDANNLTLNNCTGINNYGRQVSVGGSGTVAVTNVAGYGSQNISNDAHIDPAFSGSFTHTYNMFGGYFSALWTPDATELTGDPKILDSGKLKSGSLCLNTGVVIPGVNDGGELDIYGNVTGPTPNIGLYQGDGEGQKIIRNPMRPVLRNILRPCLSQ